MNWFKKIVIKWVREDWDKAREDSSVSQKLIASREVDCVEGDPILNFKVYSAVGGKVVEFRHYDRQKDRNFNQTYIITNEQDFGDRIAKIATMEILKQ